MMQLTGNTLVYKDKSYVTPSGGTWAIWWVIGVLGMWLGGIFLASLVFRDQYASIGLFVAIFAGGGLALKQGHHFAGYLNASIRIPSNKTREIRFDKDALVFDGKRYPYSTITGAEYARASQVSQNSKAMRNNFTHEQVEAWLWIDKQLRLTISQNYQDISWNQKLLNIVRAEIAKRKDKPLETSEFGDGTGFNPNLDLSGGATAAKPAAKPAPTPTPIDDEDGYI